MLFTCELLGALMMTCVFADATGGAASKRNEDEVCEADGIWEQLGQIIAFAVTSLVLAAIPAMLIGSLQSRSLVQLDYPGCPEWTQQLASWRAQDRLFWLTATAYGLFCAFFVALFLANVSLQDHEPLALATAIQLLEDGLILPVGMALFVPAVTGLAVGLAQYAGGGEKQEMLRKCREEKESTGNWHQVVTGI